MRRKAKREIIRLRKRLRRTQFKINEVFFKVRRIKKKWREPLSFDLDFSDDDFPWTDNNKKNK